MGSVKNHEVADGGESEPTDARFISSGSLLYPCVLHAERRVANAYHQRKAFRKT